MGRIISNSPNILWKRKKCSKPPPFPTFSDCRLAQVRSAAIQSRCSSIAPIIRSRASWNHFGWQVANISRHLHCEHRALSSAAQTRPQPRAGPSGSMVVRQTERKLGCFPILADIAVGTHQRPLLPKALSRIGGTT